MNVFASAHPEDLPSSTDSLALLKEASEVAFGELGWKIEQLIEPGLERNQLERIAVWDEGAEALRNMFAVLADKAARRYGWPDILMG